MRCAPNSRRRVDVVRCHEIEVLKLMDVRKSQVSFCFVGNTGAMLRGGGIIERCYFIIKHLVHSSDL